MTHARRVSTPTRFAVLAVIVSFIGRWLVSDPGVHLGLVWLGIGSLSWIAVRAAWLLFQQVGLDVRIANLLRRGHAREALELIDRTTVDPGGAAHNATLAIKRSAALSQLGKWHEAALALDQVPLSRLTGRIRVAFLMNFLQALLHSDVKRARAVYHRHREEFEMTQSRSSLAAGQTLAVALYGLVVENDLTTESVFQQHRTESIDDWATARATYYLGLVESRRGRTDAAAPLWREASSLAPSVRWEEVAELQGRTAPM